MCTTSWANVFCSAVGLKLNFSAGMASTAAMVFFCRPGWMSRKPLLTGSFACGALVCAPAEVPSRTIIETTSIDFIFPSGQSWLVPLARGHTNPVPPGIRPSNFLSPAALLRAAAVRLTGCCRLFGALRSSFPRVLQGRVFPPHLHLAAQRRAVLYNDAIGFHVTGHTARAQNLHALALQCPLHFPVNHDFPSLNFRVDSRIAPNGKTSIRNLYFSFQYSIPEEIPAPADLPLDSDSAADALRRTRRHRSDARNLVRGGTAGGRKISGRLRLVRFVFAPHLDTP